MKLETLIDNPALNVEDPVLRSRLQFLFQCQEQCDDAVGTLNEAIKDRETPGVLRALAARVKHYDRLCTAAEAKAMFRAEELLGDEA